MLLIVKHCCPRMLLWWHAWPHLTQSIVLAQHLKAVLKPQLWSSLQKFPEEKVLSFLTLICCRHENLTWLCPCIGLSRAR